jgi:hypothetical protein
MGMMGGMSTGAVADYVAGWCLRAQEGMAGELRLIAAPGGEIGIEERYVRPSPPRRAPRPAMPQPAVQYQPPKAAPPAPRLILKGCQRCSADLILDRATDEHVCLLCGGRVAARR